MSVHPAVRIHQALVFYSMYIESVIKDATSPPAGMSTAEFFNVYHCARRCYKDRDAVQQLLRAIKLPRHLRFS
jgi:hypothetical protein